MLEKNWKKYDKTWQETCNSQQNKEENIEKSPAS